MSTAEQVSVDVREVTEDEIRTFHDQGWVKLLR